MKRLYLLCIVLVIVACGKPERHAEDSASIIQFAISQAPLNLDPRYATDAASARINRLLYESLVDFDDQSKPTPSLASWVVVSPTDYRFTLKAHHALFHNQTPLTAYDVKATYDSLIALKDSPLAAEFVNIEHIEAVDDNTVIFHLKQADKDFPAKLIVGILPSALIMKGHDFSHDAVGSGPLKLLTWQNKLTLKRTRDNQLINLIEVKDPTVRVLKLLRGEVDLLQGELPPELIKYLQTKPEIIVHTSIGANFSYLGLNMRDSILQKLKVRFAIAHAIDRDAIMQKVMVSNTRIASAILPPEHYTNDINKNSINKNNEAVNTNLKPYDYNPALAKQLLLEAGVKLPLKLVYKTSTDAQRIRFATIMQAQMRPAGIDLEIHSLDWGTFFEDVKQGNFQLFGLSWVGIKTPEIYAKALGSESFPPNGFNRGRYTDSELDKLISQEDWPTVTARIHSQLPYIPLWYEGQFVAIRKNIKNYSPKPDGNWDDLATISKYAH